MADSPTAAHIRIFVYILISCYVVPFALCVCENGTYDHGEIKCCHCGPGQDIKEHCTVQGTTGKCVACQSGFYKSAPSKSACKRCTSCDHENAHQEEDTPCKPAADRKCRCQDGYYCNSTKIACTVCLPCTVCNGVVKAACTQHSDTECIPETTGASNAGAIAAAVIGVLATLAVFAGIIWWKKCRGNGDEEREEEQPMRPIPDDIDSRRHVPSLANAIGWKDMRRVAMSCDVPITEIENCEEQYPSDVDERTMRLLNIYIERSGRGWGEKLRSGLIQDNKKNKAQQVERILLGGEAPV